MALTPEVVVNKKFQVTKFREGYDQDEVDDFLDEIVEELRRINQENDDLRRQVAELEAQTGEEAAVPAAPAAPGQETSAESAAGVLAMAQRLHDEYVADGERKRDEIVSEAEREANRLVTEAEETSRKTLADFEQRKTILEREVEEL